MAAEPLFLTLLAVAGGGGGLQRSRTRIFPGLNNFYIVVLAFSVKEQYPEGQEAIYKKTIAARLNFWVVFKI
jgi:hypothetical protein